MHVFLSHATHSSPERCPSANTRSRSVQVHRFKCVCGQAERNAVLRHSAWVWIWVQIPTVSSDRITHHDLMSRCISRFRGETIAEGYSAACLVRDCALGFRKRLRLFCNLELRGCFQAILFDVFKCCCILVERESSVILPESPDMLAELAERHVSPRPWVFIVPSTRIGINRVIVEYLFSSLDVPDDPEFQHTCRRRLLR